MNWLDIAIMFLLAYALVRGFMRGLLGEIVLFVGFCNYNYCFLI